MSTCNTVSISQFAFGRKCKNKSSQSEPICARVAHLKLPCQYGLAWLGTAHALCVNGDQTKLKPCITRPFPDHETPPNTRETDDINFYITSKTAWKASAIQQ